MLSKIDNPRVLAVLAMVNLNRYYRNVTSSENKNQSVNRM